MELEKLLFNRCNVDDLDTLCQISKTTFVDAFEKDNDIDDFKSYIDEAFSDDRIKSELLNTNSKFYFVELEGHIVGYFKINEGEAQTDLKSANAVELERIYVVNTYQGKGVGQVMLNRIKTIAAESNREFLWLGVWENNKAAISFYEYNGFSKFGMHPYYIGKDRQMDWLMKFDLQ